ncbi:MAG: hypothetical protein ABTD50_03995 [Polyangiaceae bacterium]
MRHRRFGWWVGLAFVGCVPSGSAGAPDSGPVSRAPSSPGAATTPVTPPSALGELLRSAFRDDFERPATGGGDGSAAGGDVGPDWVASAPNIWHIESGRVCAENAKNHGLWLKKTIPVNARIEFDAVSQAQDGDIKAEFWGDGRSAATGLSYTNATSYIAIFGGWHNHYHVLARINEHGADRQEIKVVPTSEDPKEKPVVAGQRYHFKLERTDGHAVKWWVDGIEMLTYQDQAPLAGVGHDHFGFNDWDVKVCFDNVVVTPLP